MPSLDLAVLKQILVYSGLLSSTDFDSVLSEASKYNDGSTSLEECANKGIRDAVLKEYEGGSR